jgi:hypothetical protein
LSDPARRKAIILKRKKFFGFIKKFASQKAIFEFFDFARKILAPKNLAQCRLEFRAVREGTPLSASFSLPQRLDLRTHTLSSGAVASLQPNCRGAQLTVMLRRQPRRGPYGTRPRLRQTHIPARTPEGPEISDHAGTHPGPR